MDEFQSRLKALAEARATFLKCFLEVGVPIDQVKEAITQGDVSTLSPKILSQFPLSITLPDSLPLVLPT